MRSPFSSTKSVVVLIIICIAAMYCVQSAARGRFAAWVDNGSTGPIKSSAVSAAGKRDPVGIVVLDGSGIHDVGQLIMNTENWGAFGSYPSANTPISQFPSAEWPKGSGIEHLNIAGLWVGGFKGSNPGCGPRETGFGVSTAAFDMEFRPTPDPVDRIYETAAGAPGGIRLPWPGADDDGDGLIDEDPLDGRDNDGDGLIDEDFAAISDQMFSSWYTDDQPEAIAQYPYHRPLGLKVRQESYQWSDPRFDDFVGVSFTISSSAQEGLSCVYLGMFLDFDIGKKDSGEYWMDDAAGYWEGTRSTELGPATIRLAYMYDMGDITTPSYIAAMLLGHTVSADGVEAPTDVNVNAYQSFSGKIPYENGGDPSNDYERYELMSVPHFDRNEDIPRDRRVLISSGPFEISPDHPIELQVGFVCGATFDELLDNAARCQKL